MKVILNKASLDKALAIVSGAVKNNSHQEVLKCVNICTDEDGEILVRATDCETYVETTVFGDVESPGSVLIECARLRKIAANAKCDIVLEIVGNDAVLKAGEYETTLPTMDVNEFPPMPTVSDSFNKAVVKGSELSKCISRTIRVVDVDSTRFALGGVKFIIEDDKLQLVGTDGRRLCWTQCCAITSSVSHDNDSIVSESGLKNAMRCVGEGDVTVILETNSACFMSQTATVWTRLIEGRYPNWKQVIPSTDRVEDNVGEEVVQVSATDLIDCINQVSVAMDSESRGATFTLHRNKLTANSMNPSIGRSVSSVSVAYDGRKIDVQLDIDFLKDVATTFGDENFDMHILNERMPVCIRCGGDYAHVIMPMSLEK